MKIEETILPNGSTLLGIEVPGAETVAIHFGFRTGSRSEDLSVWGISHFLEHMMFKGTKKRPGTEVISREIDKLGAAYNAFTGKEYTNYYIKTSFDNFDAALDVLGDMVTGPLLLNEEIKKESGTILEEAKMYNDNPSMNIFFLMEETLYGKKTALGKDEVGIEETINAIDHKQMNDYYQKYYGGANSYTVIAGKLPKDYIQRVTKHQEKLPEAEKTKWEKAEFCENNLDVVFKDTDQAHFGLMVPGYDTENPNKYTLEVIATILGGYMSSRLFTEIREKRGWAYRVNAFSDNLSDTGYLGIYGGVKKDKACESIQIAKEEVMNLKNTITQEEIDRAKSHILGANALKYEDPNNLARDVVLSSLLTGKPETPDLIESEIKKVNMQMIKDVCEELFNGNFYLTVIGPFKDSEKFAKILSE